MEAVSLLVHARGTAIVSIMGEGLGELCVACGCVYRRAKLLRSQFLHQIGVEKAGLWVVVFLGYF